MTAPFHILNSIRVNCVRQEKQRKQLDKLWKQFGAAIRAQRRQSKVRLRDFAKDLGYTPAMISYMESGARHWPIEKAQQAVSILNRCDGWKG